jgi:hypothetical protein
MQLQFSAFVNCAGCGSFNRGRGHGDRGRGGCSHDGAPACGPRRE